MKVDIVDYIESILDYFSHEIKEIKTVSWNDKHFERSSGAGKLCDRRRGEFHTFVMKLMFFCKRERPDIEPGVSFLSTRTNDPD